jgi:tetratricopeptide (TPR) repeat protein
MELIDVLKHQGKPRTELFLDIPSAYGTLQLDILGADEAALNQKGLTSETAWLAGKMVAEARAEGARDLDAAERILLDAARKYPYYEDAYLNLFYLYDALGNATEAEYHLKQAIALAPRYDNLEMLGRFLGRNKRYDEAAVVQDHLWQTRMEAPEHIALEATQDYLVTLSRIVDADKMIEIAAYAIADFGPQSKLMYQYIYGYLLANRMSEAKVRLERVMPRLDPSDPLYSRFEQMCTFLVQNNH